MFAASAKANLTVSEEEAKAMQTTSDENGEEEMKEIDEEDQVAINEPAFRTWSAKLQAQTNCLRILLKLADFLDTSKLGQADEDDDEDFEDCEDMDEEGQDGAQAQVIDLDA